MKTCFDSQKYISLQREEILKRLKMFDNKLYMEFGGKLFDDIHASRVLPGFDENVQIKILDSFKNECEIIVCISAKDIENNKIRADFGINYEMEVERLIKKFRSLGLYVCGIVITFFENQESVIKFKEKMEKQGEKVYLHYFIKGYPADTEHIVSDRGLGKNEFVLTSRPLVVVTAPGPGSGKLATCLSQLYHEYKLGKKAGYAKFEKFPVYNLPLKHPVNLAYEASTADLNDKNVFDKYHLKAYNEIAVSYNRDMEIFPVLRDILKKICKTNVYSSPTDMGINCIKACITDDDLAKESGKAEIIRRYLKAKVDYKKNICTIDTVKRIEEIMTENNLSVFDRKCVKPALDNYSVTGRPTLAIELENGEIVVGIETDILSSTAMAFMNALKRIKNVEIDEKLFEKEVFLALLNFKKEVYKEDYVLSLKEFLIALSISSNYNEISKILLNGLKDLQNTFAHSSHILPQNTEDLLRNLKINVTCSDKFYTKNMFQE